MHVVWDLGIFKNLNSFTNQTLWETTQFLGPNKIIMKDSLPKNFYIFIINPNSY